MADKKITDLPVAGSLTDDGLLVVYQDEKTESIKGSLVKEYAAAAAKEQADAAAESAEAAAASKTAAEEAAAGVEAAEEAAAASASAALAAQGKAQTAQSAAEAAAAAAGASVGTVQEAKTAAEEAQSKAEAAQQGAATAQAAAEAAKSGADASRDSAETAKTAAETAQANAEAAKNEAQTAKEEAETARAGAEEAKTGAETARQAVENLGVSAETGEPGTDATVQKTVTDTGTVNLKFTLPRGEQGPKGEQGSPGEQGDPGAAGADGKSAYQQAKEGGYTGTETEFETALANAGNAMQKTDYDENGLVAQYGGIAGYTKDKFLSKETGGWVQMGVEFALGDMGTPVVSIHRGLFFYDSLADDSFIAMLSPIDEDDQGTKNVIGFFGDSVYKSSGKDTIGTTPVILRNIAPPEEMTDAARKGYVDTMTGGVVVVGSEGTDYAAMGFDTACIKYMCPWNDGNGDCTDILQSAITDAFENAKRVLILPGKYIVYSTLGLRGRVCGYWRRDDSGIPTMLGIGTGGTIELASMLTMEGIEINGGDAAEIIMDVGVYVRECLFRNVTVLLGQNVEISDCDLVSPANGIPIAFVQPATERATIKNCYLEGETISFAKNTTCTACRIIDNYFSPSMLANIMPTMAEHEVYARGNYCNDYSLTCQMSTYDTPSLALAASQEKT